MAGYSGDAGDAMTAAYHPRWRANGQPFSTKDRDNDDWAGVSCATTSTNGWWYGKCTTNRSTKLKCTTNSLNRAAISIWTTGSTPVYDVQASRMMLQLN